MTVSTVRVHLLPKWAPVGGFTLGHHIWWKGPGWAFTIPHEMVHVRQYERWGPAFGPAYLLCSFWLWLRRKDAYRDNPFERQAFRDGA